MGHREIQLTRGYVALVDEADYERLIAMGKWQSCPQSRTVYARKTVYRGGRYLTLRMHNVITGWSMVDHINGNGLDNRRENLRQASHQQNNGNKRLYVNNTSGYKGVVWHRKSSQWQAMINFQGRAKYLGRYATPEEAARAYDRAAIDVFGEFARINLPQES